MQRETVRAFGLSLPFKKLFKYRHFDNVDRAFKTVFIADVEQKNLHFNYDYAAQYLWISPSDLKQEVSNNPETYAPPFVTGMKIYFKDYSG